MIIIAVVGELACDGQLYAMLALIVGLLCFLREIALATSNLKFR